MTPASSPTGDTPVLVALCENSWFTEEMDEAHCMGRLHFRWGMGQAKCDTCGAWCGITVAKWERVEPAAASSSSPDDTAPARPLPCTCDYAGLEGESHKQWCEREYGPHAECVTRIEVLEIELAELRAAAAAPVTADGDTEETR